MAIFNKKVKKILVISKVATLAFSGIVFAAQEEPLALTEIAQPYVVATHAVPGTNELPAITKPMILQDVFIAANVGVGEIPIAREMFVTSTGYNSLQEQTDASPFIAADGTHVFDGMVAANFLKFGTKIKIPDYYGDKVFTVHDRMAKRFSNRVDVWFAEKPDALRWGRRTVRIQILES